MDIWALAKGFLAGAAIAAPLGPVGVLCIQRGIASGRAAAFLSGLGAATAHGTYALVAALGISLASAAFVPHLHTLRAAAGVLLCVLGAGILRSRPPAALVRPAVRALSGAYASALLIAISSPVTMLTIAAVFSGAGLPGPAGGRLTALVLAAGVFLGSASWWLTLSMGVGWISRHGGIPALRAANRVSGAVLLGFGLFLLVRH